MEHMRQEPTIATCMHGIPAVGRDGVALHDAGADRWDAILADVSALDFRAMEVADSHIRPADLEPQRLDELVAIARGYGVELPSVHVARRSVIDPNAGAANLDYAHRTIDATAAMGARVFSTGLHQPFTAGQRDALWFWTADGPRDPADPETWDLAVRRLRELGAHAADVGLRMSLELYEDTYLGTAESAVRLVESIGIDAVGLNPDVGNLIRLHRPVEDWRDVYERTLPYANYWHLKNYARDEAADGAWHTATPATLAAGLIDYRQVVRDALDAGYDGIFLMEHYGGDSLGVCQENARYLSTILDRHQPPRAVLTAQEAHA